MQPDAKVSSSVGSQQSNPIEGRSRGGLGGFIGKVAGVAGIEVNKAPNTAPVPEAPQIVNNAFAGASERVINPTVPPVPHIEKPPTPTYPEVAQDTPVASSVYSQEQPKDPGIPMSDTVPSESPGVMPEPEVVPVMQQPLGEEKKEAPVSVSPEASPPEDQVESKREAQAPIISFLEKWLLKHTLPDYVKEDGSIDDDKLERNAKDPEALKNAGMNQEIVTLVGAIEARGVEIDEMVEAGIEQVYERDQKKSAA